MGRSKSLDPRASLAAALGSKIRKLREARGWTQQGLADQMYVSASRIAQIELATDPPNEALAEDLDRVLGADDEINVAWHHMHRVGYPAWVRPYIDLEKRASRMRHFAPQLVPGLLQTPAYARTLFLSGQPGISESELNRQVEARTSRHKLLEGPDPLYFWAVLDVSILLRPFGDEPAIMGEQLAHLLAMTERPHIQLQVLPLEAGHHGLLDGALALLDFADGPGVAYLMGLGTGEIVESAEDVKRFSMIYDQLMVKSLPPEPSRDLIKTTMKERYGCHPPPNPD
ncbi:helix-turn-helix transcriptional regulator [Streptomyces sp. N2-109]|uniref:Helix-turn-helix transcriptional regulator n=1 Tax=Streptomyces gossypii TaxID=2883101 RepID=A0ABT2K3I6_9ACTN|nr:helix-turn-helix transcriptional regulator [Streptomyces gossypii]MCT2594661.1 helix-turn-helix transcriptional regulator [Streptomyces gossypii]